MGPYTRAGVRATGAPCNDAAERSDKYRVEHLRHVEPFGDILTEVD
jgi:hypothetical protein